MYLKVLDFWFDKIDPSLWWAKNREFDEEIAQNFSDLHEQATRCELSSWRTTGQGRLAEVIVLDQFSRNIYRDTAQAFACDAQALTLSQEAIAIGADESLNEVEKSFLYMPFMHSESLVIHEQAVALYQKTGISSSIAFEFKHKKIIERFGRYPHRNELLGRSSTEEEVAFLRQADSSF